MRAMILALTLGLVAAAQEKRLPVPDAAQIKEAEKSVKELFKAEYAKKTAGDRSALAKLLLNAATSQSNPAEKWVCLNQAQELAIQAIDWDIALDAVQQTTLAFEVDGPALKSAVLEKAAKSVRLAEDVIKIAERYLKLADEFLRQDGLEGAEKALAAAQPLVKKAANPGLTAQAAAKGKEIADIKSGLEKSKKSREALAKNPDDPAANLEYGLFLCMVRGQWDKGLPHLARGTEGPFRTAATRELGAPESAADRASLGDFWWDLGEKDAPNRNAARSRAMFWYERSLAGLDGLVKVRAEKRLTEGEVALHGFIDLLRQIDPEKDSVATSWRFEKGVLSPGMNFRSRLQIPFQPPEEYDLTYVLTTTAPGNPMIFGLVGGAVQFNVALEGWGRHIVSGGEKKEINPPFTKALNYGIGEAFGSENTIVISVRKTGFFFTVNGTKSVSWNGAYTKLSNPDDWAVPNKQALYIGSWDRPLEIRKITLTPISGQGRRLR
jgi:hypothetical protein